MSAVYDFAITVGLFAFVTWYFSLLGFCIAVTVIGFRRTVWRWAMVAAVLNVLPAILFAIATSRPSFEWRAMISQHFTVTTGLPVLLTLLVGPVASLGLLFVRPKDASPLKSPPHVDGSAI